MGNCAPCTSSAFLSFNRVCHYGKSNIIRRLEVGLRYFYEWALLGIGAWSDITYDMPTYGSGNASSLRVANSYGYLTNQVWEGFRTNWVYETGITYTDYTGGTHQPLPVNVYVANVLQPTGNYNINYKLGQVIFNSAPASTNVKAAYSFKNVQILLSDEVPWYQEFQYQSWTPDTNMFTQNDKGDWFVGGNHRVQFPCIIIQAAAKGTKEPAHLGGAMVYREQDVQFHILAEDSVMRDNLLDLVLLQGDRCIQLFDIDAAAAALDMPLDNNGMRVGKMYPYLLENYCWANTRIENARITSKTSYNCGLHDATVRHTYSVYFSSIC